MFMSLGKDFGTRTKPGHTKPGQDKTWTGQNLERTKPGQDQTWTYKTWTGQNLDRTKPGEDKTWRGQNLDTDKT